LRPERSGNVTKIGCESVMALRVETGQEFGVSPPATSLNQVIGKPTLCEGLVPGCDTPCVPQPGLPNYYFTVSFSVRIRSFRPEPLISVSV